MEIMNTQAKKWLLQKAKTYTKSLDKKGILAMNLGECTFPLEEIDKLFTKIDFSVARTYPTQAIEIKKLLSKKFTVPENMIVLGNGSDEIIENIPRVFLNQGDNVLVVVPTFFRFIDASKKAGSNIVFIKTKQKDNFSITEKTTKKIVQAIKSKNIKLVWLCSPNNPTGIPIKKEFIKKIASNTKSLIVLDQIYADLQENSFTEPRILVKDFPNILILKSFSKVFGLAGIRVGFAITNKPIVNALQKWNLPFNNSSISLEIVKNLLQTNSNISKKMKHAAQKERHFVLSELLKLQNIEVIDTSQTNLILFRHKTKNIFQELLQRNILVADFNNAKGIEGMKFVRVSIGTREQNMLLVKTLKKICLPSFDSGRNLSEKQYERR